MYRYDILKSACEHLPIASKIIKGMVNVISSHAKLGFTNKRSNDTGSNDKGSNDRGSNDRGSNDKGSNDKGSNDKRSK